MRETGAIKSTTFRSLGNQSLDRAENGSIRLALRQRKLRHPYHRLSCPMTCNHTYLIYALRKAAPSLHDARPTAYTILEKDPTTTSKPPRYLRQQINRIAASTARNHRIHSNPTSPHRCLKQWLWVRPPRLRVTCIHNGSQMETQNSQSHTGSIFSRVRKITDDLSDEVVPIQRNGIPRTVHFIYNGDLEIDWIKWLAVRAAIVHLRAEVVKIWLDESLEPRGIIWDQIIKLEKVMVIKIALPTVMYGAKIPDPAFQADALRLQILYDEGGKAFS